MFLQNLRARMSARLSGEREAGFTLIELLVVMLILGILAAIALPAFFNQKDKAGDARAKEYAHSAQVAMETFFTDNGTYVNATKSALEAIEPTLRSATFNPVNPVVAADRYTITVVGSKAAQTFTIDNDAGRLTYPCTVPGNGGCPSGTAGWGG